jgi:branched-subunit amino acid transport protein
MSVWIAVGVLALGTFVFRALAPVALRRMELSPTAEAAVHLVAPALLAALIGVSTFAAGRALVLDARAAGVGVAALTAWNRLPLPVVIAAAVATTAALRAVV